MLSESSLKRSRSNQVGLSDFARGDGSEESLQQIYSKLPFTMVIEDGSTADCLSQNINHSRNLQFLTSQSLILLQHSNQCPGHTDVENELHVRMILEFPPTQSTGHIS